MLGAEEELEKVRKKEVNEVEGGLMLLIKLVLPTQRRTRSSGVRIEEIGDRPKPQAIRVLIAPEYLQTQATINVPLVQESNEPEEVEICIVHRIRSRDSATVKLKIML